MLKILPPLSYRSIVYTLLDAQLESGIKLSLILEVPVSKMLSKYYDIMFYPGNISAPDLLEIQLKEFRILSLFDLLFTVQNLNTILVPKLILAGLWIPLCGKLGNTAHTLVQLIRLKGKCHSRQGNLIHSWFTLRFFGRLPWEG